MNRPILPSRIARFLRWFCPDHLQEEIEGDLLQVFQRDVRNVGERKARWRLVWNAIRFFRPGIVLRNRFSSIHFQTAIIRSHFSLAVRVLVRNKAFAGISVFGLSISVAACILVLEYAGYEMSYDTFFTQHKNIYRLQHSRYVNDELLYQKAMSFPEVGEALQHYFPEVEEVTRLFPASLNIEPVFTVTHATGETVSFSEPHAYLGDNAFTRMFDLTFVDGDPATALMEPGRMIMSESAALRYFGRTDVAGENLTRNNIGLGDITITGVFKDLPPNSHFKIDLLLSPVWSEVYSDRSRFTWDGFYNYVLLTEDADIESISARLPEFADHYMGEYYQDNSTVLSRFELQPVGNIHLHSRAEGEMGVNGNAVTVYALLVVAVFIIVIAVVNHVNLNTSRSFARIREVGIRKAIGSTRPQLTMQFLIESLLLNALSVTVGLLTVWLLYPEFNRLFNANISLHLWRQPVFWMGAVGFTLCISIITGFYPVFVFTRVKVFEALKGLSAGKDRSLIQKGLVAFQFAVSLIMITGTYVLFEQISYMQNKDLGFGIRHKLVVKILPDLGDETDSTFISQMGAVRNELQALAFVNSSTISSSIPGRKNEWFGRTRLSGEGDDFITTNLTRVDENFLETFDLRLLAGRNYASSRNNENAVIVNEESIRQLGFTDPEDALGKKINVFREREIIGIVGSFHESGLHDAIRPSVYITGEGYTKFLTVSMNGGDTPGHIAAIETIWKQYFPEKPFQYFFLDNYFNHQYEADIVMNRAISLFSAMAVVIACLGLFSLSVHTIHRKTKEIGIRKIMGAGIAAITGGLCRNFIAPVALSSWIGIPLSYYLANWWLEQYAYRVDMSLVLFAGPMVTLLTIGLLTVIVQSARAASQNPVESLRHE